MYKIIPNTLIVGKEIIYLPSCRSTNSYIKNLLGSENLRNGTIVITKEQTHGRGQLDASWESESGLNLTFSLYLQANISLDHQFYLNMAVCLAVRKMVSTYLPNQVLVKWPNDIMVDSHKISGILIENNVQGKSIKQSIIGIGLNVNQTIFQNKNAISLKNYLKIDLQLEHVFVVLLQELEKYFERLKLKAFVEIKEEYLKEMYMIHQPIIFTKEEKHLRPT